MPFPGIAKHKIKFFSLVSVGTVLFWVSTQVKKTREILNGAFDPFILHVVEPKGIEHEVYPITIDVARWIKAPSSEEPYFVTKWKDVKFAYARRLLSLAKAENQLVRTRATKQLAAISDLDSWQYSQLASSCNARTAVALARFENADLRYQIKPFQSPNRCNDEYLVHTLKEYLLLLDSSSKHPCLGNFLSNSFADIQDMFKEFENYYDHADQIAKCIKSTADMLPLCLESILHHSTIERYAKDIPKNNGLYLLLEVYFRYKHIYEINVALCSIIANISIHPEIAEELHKTGWISLLAKWAREKDLRISVTAARALANLDLDDPLKAKYKRGVYSLYPTMRTNEQTKVDVIFIHGLLGGVFYTWRQRSKHGSTLGILESLTGDPEIWSLRKYYSSDPEMQEYFDQFEDQNRMEWEQLGSDYEIVSYDIPTKANIDSDTAYVCTGYNKMCCAHEARTQCWPKDWLTQDCQHLRIIGINYDTTLSKWVGACPEECTKISLDARTEELLTKLRSAGVGSRPIVWVTHSMGGLLVKNLMVKAQEKGKEYEDFLDQTKGIVFYSTPHHGSKIANLNQPTRLVVLPSVEVQELREESPNLILIHEKFLNLVKNIPMQIVSFIETKSTVVTALKFNFLMVESQSGNPGIGEIFEVPLDHLGICKPVNRESFLYQKVLHVVQEVLSDKVRSEEKKRFETHVEVCGTPTC